MTARRAKNTNRQGANFELQIMAHLKQRGYDVLRSSGSRGAVDVVAIGDRHILMVQAKITNPVISPAERKAVRAIAARADAVPLVAYRDNGKVLFRQLLGDGPKAFESFEAVIHPWVECSCGHDRQSHYDNYVMDCGHGELTDCACLAFTFPPKESK